MIRATIVGATGYSGGELIGLLLNHSAVTLKRVTSESSSGQPLHSVHGEFRGRSSLTFEAFDAARVAGDSDVVFSCLPAAAGIRNNVRLLKRGVKVIDLSADFRLPTAALYKTWYKESHVAPQLLKTAVYGLPELFRDQIRKASLIANPGCYATAAVLAAAPLLNPLVVDSKGFIVDAKSGVSGAGKKLAAMYQFCEVDGNFHAYNVAKHRHQPEIETVLGRVSPASVRLTFTPHLVPMPRGILSVLYATLRKPMTTSHLRSAFVRFYEHAPFVRVLPEGELPQTKNVVFTNYCDIGITQDPRAQRVIVISALDNLVKGAAGQAVQKMNLCFGRPETEGLL